MHELSIAKSVLDVALRHAEGRAVNVVSLRVGRMRQVVPDSLRFYFEIVARETACDGATLELEEIEARGRCGACGIEWDLVDPVFRCPACGGTGVTIVAGEELSVDHIEVVDHLAGRMVPRRT